MMIFLMKMYNYLAKKMQKMQQQKNDLVNGFCVVEKTMPCVFFQRRWIFFCLKDHIKHIKKNVDVFFKLTIFLSLQGIIFLMHLFF